MAKVFDSITSKMKYLLDVHVTPRDGPPRTDTYAVTIANKGDDYVGFHYIGIPYILGKVKLQGDGTLVVKIGVDLKDAPAELKEIPKGNITLVGSSMPGVYAVKISGIWRPIEGGKVIMNKVVKDMVG